MWYVFDSVSHPGTLGWAIGLDRSGGRLPRIAQVGDWVGLLRWALGLQKCNIMRVQCLDILGML
jgi:hypothetical protein